MSIKAWIEQNSTETAQFEDFVRNLNGLGAENQNDSAMGTGIFFKGYANPALGTYELCFNNGPEYPAKLFTPDERQAWYDKIATCFPSLETIEVETYGQERMLKIQSSGVDFVALESVLTEWNNAAAEKSKSLTKFIQSLQSESIAIVCGKSHSHIVPQKELKNDGQFSKLMADVTEKEIKSPLIQACFVSNNEPSIFRIWDKNFYNYY